MTTKKSIFKIPAEIWLVIIPILTRLADVKALRASCRFFAHQLPYADCLLLRGDIDQARKRGTSPGKIVHWLLKNRESSEFVLKFQEWFRRNEEDLVRLFIDNYQRYSRFDPSAKDNLMIRITCTNGYDQYLKTLMHIPRVCSYVTRMLQAVLVRKLLADPRTDPSAMNNEAIPMAAKFSGLDIIEMLLNDPRVDPADCDNEAIRNAARGDLALVKRLLRDPRVDPSAMNDGALCIAIIAIPIALKWSNACCKTRASMQRHRTIGLFEWRRGATRLPTLSNCCCQMDPTVYYNEPLRNACEYECTEIVHLLLADARVDPSAGDQAPIRRAAKWGQSCNREAPVAR